MPRCAGIIQHDNRGQAGKPCTRYAVRGSSFCQSHGGVATSTTPDEIQFVQHDNTRVHCVARSTRTGEPCRNWAMHGSTVCVKHGGRAPHTLQAAAERMLALRLKAIGVVDGCLDDPNLDPAIRLRAAQIVLDRTGIGPSSTIAHVQEVKPYERLLAGATVIRDLELEPGDDGAKEDNDDDDHQVIDAEVVEQEGSSTTEPAGEATSDDQGPNNESPGDDGDDDDYDDEAASAEPSPAERKIKAQPPRRYNHAGEPLPEFDPNKVPEPRDEPERAPVEHHEVVGHPNIPANITFLRRD